MLQSSNIQDGRPEEPISMIRQLSYESKEDGAFFSFERSTREVALVRNRTHYFVRVTEDNCCAEANGRPVSSHSECYYVVTVTDTTVITANNWKEKVVRPFAYHYVRSSYGTF